MAKTTAPLLSFDGRGQIGKTQVYASWKGRPYARRYAIPSNPNTAEQQSTRTVFAWLQQVYKFAPSIVTDVWEAYATGKVMTSRNAFTKFNNGTLRGDTALDDMILSPGALGGIPAATYTNTFGNDQITIAATAPTVIPSGWTLTGLQGAVIRDQDPHSGALYNITAGEDLTAAYSFVLSSLAAGDWLCASWLKWLRPDGKVAYSPSNQEVGTVT